MRRFFPYLGIFVLGAVLFSHSLGKVPLFDWDEINFAESAREMISAGNYMRVQINYEPFWEKPPFFLLSDITFFNLNRGYRYVPHLPIVLQSRKNSLHLCKKHELLRQYNLKVPIHCFFVPQCAMVFL